MGRAHIKPRDSNPTLEYEIFGFTESDKDVNIPISALGVVLAPEVAKALGITDVPPGSLLVVSDGGDTLEQLLLSDSFEIFKEDGVRTLKLVGVGPDPTIYGKNKRFSYLGFKGTSPLSDAGVQSLAVGSLLKEDNSAVFSESIPAGTQEVSFYAVRGSSLGIVDGGNHSDVTRALQTSDIAVSDIDGTLIDYTKHTIHLGLGGFLTDTVFTITIQ